MLRERIIKTAVDEFRNKQLKFTMDDLAVRLSISKRTLYKLYATKSELLCALVDHVFDGIKSSEAKLISSSIPLPEKLRRVIIAMPDRYREIDISGLPELRNRYPDVCARLEARLSGEWEPTFELLREGMAQGFFRPIDLNVLRDMVTATIQRFIIYGTSSPSLDYSGALEAMMDIIMSGITQRIMDDKENEG